MEEHYWLLHGTKVSVRQLLAWHGILQLSMSQAIRSGGLVDQAWWLGEKERELMRVVIESSGAVVAHPAVSYLDPVWFRDWDPFINTAC